ncbi:MAG: restriction endonuclease [Minicystis sp.]
MRRDEFQDALNALPSGEFERLVADFLATCGLFSRIEVHAVRGGAEVDAIAYPVLKAGTKGGGRPWVVDVKRRRLLDLQVLEHTAARLNSVRTRMEAERALIVVSGLLSAEARELVPEFRVEVWDANYLYDNLSEDIIGQYFGSAVASRPKRTDPLLKGGAEPSKATALTQALSRIQPGPDDALSFQKVVSDVLEFVFCPPLQPPQYEISDKARRNRRDMIFEMPPPSVIGHIFDKSTQPTTWLLMLRTTGRQLASSPSWISLTI